MKKGREGKKKKKMRLTKTALYSSARKGRQLDGKGGNKRK